MYKRQVFTSRSRRAELLDSLRLHGRGIEKYDHRILGLNSRLDTLQAAVLDVYKRPALRHLQRRPPPVLNPRRQTIDDRPCGRANHRLCPGAVVILFEVEGDE